MRYSGLLKAGFFILIILAIVFACSTERSTTPFANLPPDTHLFLKLSDSLPYPGETVSMQILHWYGDDPDGEISGFEWAWDDTSLWTFTPETMDTFYVPIRVAHDTFQFFIRAIDNEESRDPTPDNLYFPIKNSPPEVTFPVDFIQRYSRVRYVSFSYFTIGWGGTDPDGDETITHYEWYLADSSFFPDSASIDTMSWNLVDSLTTRKVFNNLSPGSYRFFLRCEDVAGAYSNIVFYPDTLNGAAWIVREPIGSTLLLDDNIYFFGTDSTNFNSALTAIYGADNYTTWNITERIPYYPQDLLATLSMFENVIWNGSSSQHFNEAQGSLVGYVAAGGHLLMSSTHAFQDTVIYPFLPIDSITIESISRVFTITRSTTATLPAGYPDTLSSPHPVSNTFGFIPGTPIGLGVYPAQELYKYQSYTVAARYPAYEVSNPRPAQIIYFSMYYFDCINDGGFQDLMEFILTEEFNDGAF